ncbi:MAG: HIT domain-containing protein [Gammaproteobacteria bacterium]|nr:HIT domain-containing protein [Gammaproteobacteria bacterium]
MFVLHPTLKRDCFVVGHFPLSVLLLMNDSSFPWFILVPARDSVTEIYQLNREDRLQLMEESYQLSLAMQTCFQPDKLNIAAIGNMVPQLHMHHVARYKNDTCWPKPVWGNSSAKPYSDSEYEFLLARFLPKVQQLEGFNLEG